ncbi:homoserine dehydrogenase [Salicibibacter halophilus]|uniref:Homoserine dehydrogenase n=1 Tax=Salicibibacter halophilus TaxID=2502791 RepID=A0A514LMN6_9BACI|nr:homoserine dehydrogenase [Salicibibacter halophilus]QDI93078.1 homoserine dehydrogenase [Salicibibacter halophilus]
MKKAIEIGILGLGTVGNGIIHILEHHKNELIAKTGAEDVTIRKVLVRDLEKQRGGNVEKEMMTTNAEDVLDDPNIDLVIEVMGGIDEAKQYIEKALKSGKHVVSANKDLIALHGDELLTLAEENDAELLYEASVAGGIPILRTLTEGLASDRITKMIGIVNGTTNYMLTKMTKEELSYDEALQQAKDLGFAESDPTADLEGLDAARKMVILARLGFSASVQLDEVYLKGMTEVTAEDIDFGQQLGYTLKLIGLASRSDEGIEVSVEPVFIPEDHPLASVNDEYNAVYVYGEAVGETMFYGPGAGSLPTATAVVSDVVSVIRQIRLGTAAAPMNAANKEDTVLKKEEDIRAKYFIRLHVHDVAGAFKSLTSVFTSNKVSFEKLIQMPMDSEELAEVVMVTHETSRTNFEQIAKDLENLDVVETIKSRYRVEGGEADVPEQRDLALV